MADHQGSTTDDRDQENPFTKPAFLVAGGLILVIVLLGVILAVRVASSSDATTPMPAPTDPGTSTAPPSAAGDPAASVCGLPGGPDIGPLASAPAVTWDYQGTIAYPSSPEFGPGKAASGGYRYCFQHSPAGAVVMAANAIAQGSDPELSDTWSNYVLGEGRYRDQLAGQIGRATGVQGSRLKVAGFRILSYTGSSARVDLGVRGSSQNQNLTVSGVYELKWQDGDWKISADVERPLDVASIPDLAGYVPWGE